MAGESRAGENGEKGVEESKPSFHFKVADFIVRNSRALILILSPILSLVSTYNLGFNRTQMIAVAAFTMSVLGAFLYWRYKLIIAFTSVTILLMLGIMDVETLIESAEFDIILFLIAMTLIVSPLKRVGFFRWLTILLLKASKYSMTRLLIYFMFTSMILAAVMGAVTSIVLTSTMIMEFCSYFELDPTILLIGSILATNIGSSATALGNPVGLVLALGAGLSFEEFIRWASPPAVISVVIIAMIFAKYYRQELMDMQRKLIEIVEERGIVLDIWSAVGDIKKFSAASLTFTLTILAITLHKSIEHVLHLKGITMLVGIAFLGAAAALMLYREEAKEIVEREVDWWSILFIAFLFGQTGALKYTGVTEKIAELMINFAGGSKEILIAVIAGAVLVLSAFLDNVPTVAAFIPIVLSLEKKGLEVYPLWWIILIAGCYAGNLTPLASAANIVALGILEKRNVKITFKDWLKMSVPPTIITFVLALAIILVQIHLF